MTHARHNYTTYLQPSPCVHIRTHTPTYAHTHAYTPAPKYALPPSGLFIQPHMFFKHIWLVGVEILLFFPNFN